MHTYITLFIGFLYSFFTPTVASAHVGYVVSEADQLNHSGQDILFLMRPFANTTYVALMIGTVIIALFLFLLLKHHPFFVHLGKRLDHKAVEYEKYYPWILRLSTGIALIGAGPSHALISPIMSATGAMASLQILFGFMILAGFLIGPAALGACALYGAALMTNTYMLGNLDMFVSALVLLAFAHRAPGVDDILNIPFIPHFRLLQGISLSLLRVGIGIAMMFLAIYEKILNPHISELVVTQYHLTNFVPVAPEMWVLGAALVELFLGFALFIGFQVRLLSAIAFIVLSASFFFFSEAVYSHITLFAVLSILFVSGGKKLPAPIKAEH